MDSKDAFTLFANLLPEPMLLVARDHEVLAINQSGTRLSGYSAANQAGTYLDDLVLESHQCISSLLRAWSRSKDLSPGTLTLVGHGGPPTECRAEGAVFRAKSPHAPAIILIRLRPKSAVINRFLTLNERVDALTRQVSRRRQAEQALDAEREWLRVTLNSIGDAVIAADTHGRVTFINPVACTLTGVEAQNAFGTPLREIFHIIDEQTRDTMEDPVSKVLQRGEIVGLTNHTVLVRKDGTELPIDDSAAPIRGEDGKMRGVVLVFHDVTQRRTLERELRERTEKLAQTDRRKDEFLAMLAHELRNPLASLLTGSHILRAIKSEDAMTQRTGDMMDQQIQHLSRLIDDLLDVSRITRGKIQLSRAPVSLRSILERALEMADPLMGRQSHKLSVSLPPDSIYVDADATRMIQVFANLLENAAKFTPTGGEIALHAEAVGENVEVHVQDNGVGIEPAMLLTIFELFTQGDKSLDRTEAGLGLGLTVVKTLTEMHGGTVVAESGGPGQGSNFVVRLPIQTRLPLIKPSRESSSQSKSRTATPKRVLVVDDNADAADSLAQLLKLNGHETLAVYGALEALECASTFRADIAVLDIGLPEMDGYELARRLRATRSDLVLIALTGYGQPEDVQRAQEAGFDVHLTKPATYADIERILETTTHEVQTDDV